MVIERRYVGGSCPNIACLPSKNVIQSAKVANYFRRGKESGITPGNWSRCPLFGIENGKRSKG